MCFSKFSIGKFILLSSKIILNAENVLSTPTDVTGQYLKCFAFDVCTFTGSSCPLPFIRSQFFFTFLFRKRTIVHSFVGFVNSVGEIGWERVKAGTFHLFILNKTNPTGKQSTITAFMLT